MTVRIRLSTPYLPGVSPRRHRRRDAIYPHRSIRAVPSGVIRWVLAGSIAAGMTLAMVVLLSTVLKLHNQLCVAILQLSGIPISGSSVTELFGSWSLAPVAAVAVPELSSRPVELWALFVAVTLVLLELYRRIPFGRSFILFFLTLLVSTAGVIAFEPSIQFGSVEFASMWLRLEVLVWFVLPSVTAGLYVLTQPAAWFGVAWVILTQLYGILWSAIRLAFGIAMMHYTGILFMPMFWFAGGLLADVIYVVVFYSVSIHRAARKSWGERIQ